MHTFHGELTIHLVGGLRYHAVYLPKEIQAQLPTTGRGPIRARGTMNGRPWEGAWMPTGKGGYYAMVGSRLRQELSIELGEVVDMRFDLVDPDHVELPEEIRRAIDREEGLEFKWEILTPGAKRALAHFVTSARRDETRRDRAAQVCAALERASPGENPRRYL